MSLLRNRCAALLKGDTKVAYLYEGSGKEYIFVTASTNMVQVLNHSVGGFSANHIFSGNEWDDLEKLFDEIDVFVVSRGSLHRRAESFC